MSWKALLCFFKNTLIVTIIIVVMVIITIIHYNNNNNIADARIATLISCMTTLYCTTTETAVLFPAFL